MYGKTCMGKAINITPPYTIWESLIYRKTVKHHIHTSPLISPPPPPLLPPLPPIPPLLLIPHPSTQTHTYTHSHIHTPWRLWWLMRGQKKQRAPDSHIRSAI